MEHNLTEEEKKLRITDPKILFPIFQKIFQREEALGLNKEHFWVVGLNYAGVLRYIDLTALGSTNRVAVTPTDVYQFALLREVNTIIIVYNHPSGLLNFSSQDLDLTDKFIQVGKLFSIDLVDHLIVTPKKYVSLREIGLYEEIYKSPKYLTPYLEQEIELIKARREARQQVLEQIKPAIVKMYENNIPPQEIAEVFTLKVSEVKQILDID